MAYKYQPIKDEIFDSEDEDEIEEIQDEIEDEVLQEEESILGIEEQNSSSDATEHEVVTGRPPVCTAAQALYGQQYPMSQLKYILICFIKVDMTATPKGLIT